MIFHRVESIAHRPQNLLGGRCLVTPFFQPCDEADLPCNTFARCRNMSFGHTQVLKFYFSIHLLNRHKCAIHATVVVEDQPRLPFNVSWTLRSKVAATYGFCRKGHSRCGTGTFPRE